MRKQKLIESCAEEVGDEKRFRDLCRLIEATVHHRYRKRLESLERLYAPVDPDDDTVDDPGEATETGLKKLEEELVALLEAADFEEVSGARVERALRETALLRVQMDVDLDAYERVLFYGRGASRRTETLSRWLGLRERTVEFTNYDRVLVYVRQRVPSEDDEEKRERTVVLKLFRNVPEHDIEMLLPDPEVRMRTADRLMIGVPAVISAGLLLTTKAGAQLLLLGAIVAFWVGLRDREVDLDYRTVLAALMGLMAVGSFVWRQWDKYQNRRMQFLKGLSERLYFKSLGNGGGVIHQLLGEAEDQECREAILAAFLLHTAERPLTIDALDERAEAWLHERTGTDVDFEIRDALDKLEEFRVLERTNDDRLSLLPLEQAIQRMDEAWDAEFP